MPVRLRRSPLRPHVSLALLGAALFVSACAPAASTPKSTTTAANVQTLPPVDAGVVTERLRAQLAPDPHARMLLDAASRARAKQRVIQVQLFALDEAIADVGPERAAKLEGRRDALASEATRALGDAITAYAQIADDPSLAESVSLDEVLAELGRALHDVGQDEKAAERYQALVTRFPASPRAPRAHMALAERAFAEERLEDVIAHCDAVLAAGGEGRVEALYLKAWSLRGLGEERRPGATAEAIAALEAIRHVPTRTAAEARIATSAQRELEALRAGCAAPTPSSSTIQL
ncbi:tetratricopeptide repeat protein [Polyangium aurulentum]|uniref:tetratricopeptide repeat protein n=1 Tax=Polyangium aurulentum TaxID=2567896 RepID=UPI0010ADDC63|nr:tetratricopeptide repeat protein [Polyangium aurulentum]UQA60728.1 tetratricopeptide repeat protein [Polyangium aurulentum]